MNFGLENKYNEQALHNLCLRMDDMYSMGLLQSLLNGYPYIPFTTFSFRPFCLNVILNDIIINHRKSIIEFGSGISTVLIGRLIKKNDLHTTIISFEHNDVWVDVMKKMLKNEQLDDVVQIVHAPLKESAFSTFSPWYDPEVIENSIENNRFDLVVVDGPPAWEKAKEKARYPALPFLKERLTDTFCILLDDANRAGEKNVLQLWEQQLGFTFSLMGGSLACHRTDSFEAKPFWTLGN